MSFLLSDVRPGSRSLADVYVVARRLLDRHLTRPVALGTTHLPFIEFAFANAFEYPRFDVYVVPGYCPGDPIAQGVVARLGIEPVRYPDVCRQVADFHGLQVADRMDSDIAPDLLAT